MEWMPIFSKVLEAVLIAVLPPLAVALVAWLIGQVKIAWARFKELNPTVADYLELAAEFAVKAAEQAGAAALIKNKKEYAIQIAEAWLATYHITTDIDLISAAIEKAVGELFPHDQPVGYNGVG